MCCGGFRGLPSHIFRPPLSIVTLLRLCLQAAIVTNIVLAISIHEYVTDPGYHGWYNVHIISLAVILGLNSLSILFIVEKFYWMKTEGALTIGCLVMCMPALAAANLIPSYPSIERRLQIAKALLLAQFCLLFVNFYWAIQKTANSVSNLFIFNWSKGLDESSVELAVLSSDDKPLAAPDQEDIS